MLSGSSLREWRYGIRAGLVAEFKGGASGVCDWWGTTENLLRRSLLPPLTGLQGYLAHKKTPTPLGPPQDPCHRPTVGSHGGAFSCK